MTFNERMRKSEQMRSSQKGYLKEFSGSLTFQVEIYGHVDFGFNHHSCCR